MGGGRALDGARDDEPWQPGRIRVLRAVSAADPDEVAPSASDDDVAWWLDREAGGDAGSVGEWADGEWADGDGVGEVAAGEADRDARRRERLIRRRARTVPELARDDAPVVLGRERTLPVLGPLQPVLADAALVRGTTVGVAGGTGATSLALALAAGASRSGSWVAVVGLDDLGLVAATGLGVDPARLVLVREPPARAWGQVVASAVEAVDVVVVAPRSPVGGVVARRLAARCRERGAVLVVVGDAPGGPGLLTDLTVQVTASSWRTAAADGGHLVGRVVEVEATGRGPAARPRRTRLWLPGPHGAPASLAPDDVGVARRADGAAVEVRADAV
jgi:hypothetical protein